MRRPSVDPAFTFGVSLALSVVLWYPTLRQTMNGNIEITDSGIRYLLALGVAWAGVFGVSSLVARYANKARDPAPPPPDSGAQAATPVRRPGHATTARETVSESVESDAA
jgi:hypothetical protein